MVAPAARRAAICDTPHTIRNTIDKTPHSIRYTAAVFWTTQLTSHYDSTGVLMVKHNSLFLNDNAILAVVIINTIVIFLLEVGISNPLVVIIDAACTIFFLIEMMIKHAHLGIRGYWSKSINVMDGLLVILSLPSLINYFIDMPLSDFSFLMALRSLRIFRIFRIESLFPGFAVIARNLRLALKQSSAFLLAILLFIIIFALIDCGLFASIAPKYFGTPFDSIYSTFRIFSVEGWYEIPDTIAAGLGSSIWTHLTRIYFCAQLFVGGIIGMSLINSIFVDAMVSDNNDVLDAKVDKLQHSIDELREMVMAKNNTSNGEDN